MTVAHIVSDTETDRHIIVLQMEEDRIYLLLGVGPIEAHSIAGSLSEVGSIRPYSHDLMKAVLDGLGACLDSVIICSVVDHVFHAKLVINHQNKRLELDARPSDGISLALKCGAPVFVTESVIDESGVFIDYNTNELVPLAGTFHSPLDKDW